jgi:hypothetical protein
MARTRLLTIVFTELLVGMCMPAFPIYGQSISVNAEEGAAGEPYPNMPTIPPIGCEQASTSIFLHLPKGPPSIQPKGIASRLLAVVST